MKLKKYETHQKEKIPKKKFLESGVACTEKKCKGEMMIGQPEVRHPEYPELRRASCGKCSWRGWV